jgi:excisionase family DNA binding protein
MAKRSEAREVMDVRQAAHYLGLSGDTLYKYASEGLVPAFKFGNRWRFRKHLLDQWMDEKSMENVRKPDASPAHPLIGDHIDNEPKSSGGETYARETEN